MGMTAGLYRASEGEIRKLFDGADSVRAFIEGTTWVPPLRDVRPKGVGGWLMRLAPISVREVDPDAVPPPGYSPARDGPFCDLEKTWHGLHFLFTGTAWEGDEPACYLVRGGEDVGGAEELGYSVLQALSPAKVRRFAEFLRSLSRQELKRRFDPKQMMALEIYPDIWTSGPAVRDAPSNICWSRTTTFEPSSRPQRDSDQGALVYVT